MSLRLMGAGLVFLCLVLLRGPAGLRAQEAEGWGEEEQAAAPVEAAAPTPVAETAGPEAGDDWGEEDGEEAAGAGAEGGSLIAQVAAKPGSLEAWEKAKRPRWPRLEWHGYMRFRGYLLGDADLATYNPLVGSGTSWVKPPLHDNYINSNGSPTFSGKMGKAYENTIGFADMRLRLAPVIHAWDRVRIGMEVDFLDNLVLGSTPDFDGRNVSPLVPLDTLTLTQVPPVSGQNSYSDSVVVKAAWAEWLLTFDDKVRPDSFNMGVLKLGRFAFPWGMGVLGRAGDYSRSNPDLDTMSRLQALDAEGANWLDRAMWTVGLPMKLKFMAGYSWLASGAVGNASNPWLGQGFDLEQSDDVAQVEVALFKRPDTEEEFQQRRTDLFSGSPVLDYGLYFSYRQWKNEILDDGCCTATGDCSLCYDKLVLAARDAWLATPDLWVRFDVRPSPGKRFTAQAEGFMNKGRISHAGGVTEKDYSVEVDSWGAALETLYWMDKVAFGLDIGAASGDDAEIFDTKATGAARFGADRKSTLGFFNPDYRQDQLLYRYVLGSVYNTAYFKPHFRFDLLPTEENALGGMLSILYALSMDPKGYPGNSRNLGLEFEANAFYEETDRLLAALSVGFLFPFAALDRPAKFLDPAAPSATSVWAWTIQGKLFFTF